MRYFRKEDVRNKCYTGAGWPIPFKDFGGYTGGIETDDAYIITEISKLISNHQGGVIEVTAQQYDDLKKKENQTSYPSWREVLSVRQLLRLREAWQRGSAAVGKKITETVSGYSETKVPPRPSGPSTFRPQGITR